MNTCQCGDPATRLVKVKQNDITSFGYGDTAFSIDRSTTFACCEDHRHQAKKILEDTWRDEVDQEKVVVRLGPRRKAGS